MTNIFRSGTTAKTLALLAICSILFSFSAYRGAYHFRIVLNGQTLLDQYAGAKQDVKSFNLGQAAANDQLSIYFNECGRTGEGRSIAIKDEHNKTLKQWNYGNGNGQSVMSCKVGDIRALQTDKNGKLQLYYASKALPDGHLLAAIVPAGKQTASR